MKRTTYILMGLIGSGLVVIIAVCFAMFMKGAKNIVLETGLLSSEMTKVDLSGVHVLKMDINLPEDVRAREKHLLGKLKITPCADTEQEQIIAPKSQYLNIVQRNDTLCLEFDLKAYEKHEGRVKDKWKSLYLSTMDLNIKKLTSITSEMNGVEIIIEKMSLDSLNICGKDQKVLIDSCQVRSLDVAGRNLSFHAKDSKIENYYLNLDNIWRWTFENTQVGTEYLTGSGMHTNQLRRGECRRVVWVPASKDAELNMVLHEPAEIILGTDSLSVRSCANE